MISKCTLRYICGEGCVALQESRVMISKCTLRYICGEVCVA
ncbi:hypothetical protein GDO81_028714 [Engystomops pustulosus]|uniref:Uncharacterized protein n=1 Tax=Engystomops pustulosus TaxID=76066 RepID=A0AAV6ZG66_ENGPU|nr:hypothetical protein GDO81_028714 [Engystomops pustulosus]